MTSIYSLSIIGGLGHVGQIAQPFGDRLPGIFGINDNGDVAGRFIEPNPQGNQSPFTLAAFSTTGMSPNLGPPDSQAFAVNNSGQVVGRIGERAFVTTSSHSQIEDPIFIDDAVVAFGINDNGDVVGVTSPNPSQPSVKPLQPFVKLKDAPLQPITDKAGVAYSINNFGEVVGRETVGSNQHAFAYLNGKVVDLGTFRADNSGNSLARAVDDLGLIVGRADTKTDKIHHAFVTLASSFGKPGISEDEDLKTLSSDSSNANSEALDINNRLQVVGQSDIDSGKQHAFLLDPSFTKMRDLNDLIRSKDQASYELTVADAINENGVIVGSATLKHDQDVKYEEGRTVHGTAGDIFAYRLTPIPDEPIQLEAENFNLDNYRTEDNSAASSGKVISLRDVTGNTGIASTRFTGLSGDYDIVVGYSDETDGQAQLQLKVNDSLVDSWKLDANLGGNGLPTAETFTQRAIKNVSLDKGDILSIVGTRDGGEQARVDFIKLTPTDSLQSLNANLQSSSTLTIVR